MSNPKFLIINFIKYIFLSPPLLPALNYGVNEMPIKIPTRLFFSFVEIDEMIIKFIQIQRTNIKLGNFYYLVSRHTLSYKASVIKIEGYLHKERHTCQWKRKESPKINPHISYKCIVN